MAIVQITASADADIADIVFDLAARPASLRLNVTLPDSTLFSTGLLNFPILGRHGRNWALIRELGSFRPTSRFTTTKTILSQCCACFTAAGTSLQG